MKITALIMTFALSLSLTSLSNIPSHLLRAHPVEKNQFDFVSTDGNEKKTYTMDVYFSEDYFHHSSEEYDPHLATTSFALSASTATLDVGPFDDDYYLNQSKDVKAFFEKIQFEDFTINEDFKIIPTMNTLGLCGAKRTYQDFTVVAIAPRSCAYRNEWGNNATLGLGDASDYMHEGWYFNALKMIDFTKEYVSNENITGKIKLWFAGYSRGGAIANLAAGLLDNQLDKGEKIFENVSFTRQDLFTYTFESPQGANVYSKTVKAPKDKIYNNIFNVINPLDIVPKLPMAQYGFTRFGRDKFITNEFYDPSHYVSNRETFSQIFHNTINKGKKTAYAGDDFVMKGFEIESVGLDLYQVFNHFKDGMSIEDALSGMKDKTKSRYDINIVMNLFLEEFVKRFGDRTYYVQKLQLKLETLLDLLFDTKEGFHFSMPSWRLLQPILLILLVDNFIGRQLSIKEALSSLIGESAYAVIGLITGLASPMVKTYWEKPNECISMVANYAKFVPNHFTHINLGHLASQDSYYVDTYNREKGTSLSVVPLLDNADYGRMSFFGFNDLGLRLESKNGSRVVNVDGHYFGKSEVKDCDSGYAFGYYSYITEEKMELFMPVNRKYNISMKSYSKKPKHRVEYWAYYERFALANDINKKIELDHKKATAYFNSDRYKRDVKIAI